MIRQEQEQVVETEEFCVPSILDAAAEPRLRFAWMEITGSCQERCVHCYADSSPQGTHGEMTEEDWKSAIDQTAELGTEMVQFIGGEPTLHPAFPSLVDFTLQRGVAVEVFSNLSHITPRMWGVFEQPGVRLATSYYSPNPAEHEAITNTRGSHKRTRQNIAEAVERGIPIRAGIIGVKPGQDVEGAVADLLDCGVDLNRIGVDFLRQVGRGIVDREATVKELCVHCGDQKVAILPSGDVTPCVFSRWMSGGNVREQRLDSIIKGQQFQGALQELREEFASRQPTACWPDGPCIPEEGGGKCLPDLNCEPKSSGVQNTPSMCHPNDCNPGGPCFPDVDKCGPNIHSVTHDQSSAAKAQAIMARLGVARLGAGCSPADGCSPDVKCFPDAGIVEPMPTHRAQRCDPHPPGCAPDDFPPVISGKCGPNICAPDSAPDPSCSPIKDCSPQIPAPCSPHFSGQATSLTNKP